MPNTAPVLALLFAAIAAQPVPAAEPSWLNSLAMLDIVPDIEVDERRPSAYPLHTVALYNQPEAAVLLYGEMPIHFAAWADQVDVVRLLLARDINVDTRSKRCGETPLHVAAKKGALRMITLLVERGADLRSISRDGLTPYQAAGMPPYSTTEALALLRRLGARQ